MCTHQNPAASHYKMSMNTCNIVPFLRDQACRLEKSKCFLPFWVQGPRYKYVLLEICSLDAHNSFEDAWSTLVHIILKLVCTRCCFVGTVANKPPQLTATTTTLDLIRNSQVVEQVIRLLLYTCGIKCKGNEHTFNFNNTTTTGRVGCLFATYAFLGIWG